MSISPKTQLVGPKTQLRFQDQNLKFQYRTSICVYFWQATRAFMPWGTLLLSSLDISQSAHFLLGICSLCFMDRRQIGRPLVANYCLPKKAVRLLDIPMESIQTSGQMARCMAVG